MFNHLRKCIFPSPVYKMHLKIIKHMFFNLIYSSFFLTFRWYYCLSESRLATNEKLPSDIPQLWRLYKLGYYNLP